MTKFVKYTFAFVAIQVVLFSCAILAQDQGINGIGNPNSAFGHLSPDLFEAHPQLTFIGRFGSKLFYIERNNKTQFDAREGCLEMGMDLLHVDSQLELNFLKNATYGVFNYAWTDGVVRLASSSFKWLSTNQTITGELRLESKNDVGLVVAWTEEEDPILATLGSEYEMYYYCYVETV